MTYTVDMQSAARWKPVLFYSFLVAAMVLVIRSGVAGYNLPSQALSFSPIARLSIPGQSDQTEAIEWYRGCKRGNIFQPGVYSQYLDLEPPASGIDPDAWYVLVLPSINGAAVRVYLDGGFLGAQGDFAQGQSSIWNSTKIFQIKPGLLRADTSVQIDLLGIYEAGVIKQPYIMERAAAGLRLVYLSFISEQLVWLVCGAILVMGFSIMAIGYASSAGLDGRMILGLAAVCTSFFLADFLTFEYLPLSLLTFKKMVVLLRHLAAILFIYGFLGLLGRKLDWFAKLFSAVQLVCAILALLPATVLQLKELYTYTYLTILPFLFYLLYLLYHTRQEGSGRRFLLVGVSVGVVAAMHDILITLFFPNSILISHFGFMVLTLATTAFVVCDISQNYRQLVIEKSRAEAYREASLHDPLTGIFNRGILPLVRESLNGPFAILLADLDDFKAINDTYGHLIGDRVLIDLVAVMTRVFRRGDFIVRSGGDEFLAILPACPVAAIEDLKAKLVHELARSRISVHEGLDSKTGEDPGSATTACDHVIGYSASIGSAHYHDLIPPDAERFEDLIAEADRRLYEVKRRRCEVKLNPGRS